MTDDEREQMAREKAARELDAETNKAIEGADSPRLSDKAFDRPQHGQTVDEPALVVGSLDVAAKIIGYRDLTQPELDLINQVKASGLHLSELVAALRAAPGIDRRWVSVGATHMQEGLMALVRAIAQPTTF